MLALALATATCVTLMATPASGAPKKTPAKPPAGAVKATTTMMSGVTCGKVRGSWVPGRRVARPRGYFVPLQRDLASARASAAKQKGARKRTSMRRVKALQVRLRTGTAACRAAGRPAAAAPGTTPGAPASPGGPPPVFALSDAVALGIGQGATTRSLAGRLASAPDALMKIRPDDQVVSALVSGQARVTGVFPISPSTVVVSLDATKCLPGGPGPTITTCLPEPWRCYLARVDVATGQSTCIEDSFISQTFSGGGSPNPRVQQDASGALYYLTNGANSAGFLNLGVLTRYAGGERTRMTHRDVQINDFLVMPSGLVLGTSIRHETFGCDIRLILGPGQAQVISSTNGGVLTCWLALGPDGNAYFPRHTDTGTGSSNTPSPESYVARVVDRTGAKEDYLAPGPDAVIDTGRWNAPNPALGGLCATNACWQAGTLRSLVRLGDQLMAAEGGQVVRLYPADDARPAVMPTSWLQIDGLVPAGQRLGVLGVPDFGPGPRGIVLINPNTGGQVAPWPATVEYMAAAAFDGVGSILFSGFSGANRLTSTWSSGKIDVLTGEATLTGTIRLDEIKPMMR